MKQIIWTQDFLVSSFLVNSQRKLGIYSLLNLLQDTAWMHATHLGHGHAETLLDKTAWVLTRQKVVMTRWPHWGEKITIRTWVRPLQSSFAVRDFEILSGDDIIGTSSTSWVLMNIETRTAILSPLEIPFEPRNDYRLPYDPKKVLMSHALEPRAKIEVRNSDLDMNEHVNNTRYVQWLLDSIPREWHRQFHLDEYEVNFLSETHSGDQIDILMSPEKPDEKDSFPVQFQGLRLGKPVFTAEMKVTPIASSSKLIL